MATLAPLVISGGRHQRAQSADVITVPNAGTTSLPSLILAGDVNTGIWHPAADTLAISTNAVERVRFGTTEVVVNDTGASVDFRVEGNTDANTLLVSGADDAVAMGTSNIASGNKLTVSSSSTSTDIDAAPAFFTVRNTSTTNNTFSSISFQSLDTGGTIFGGARIICKMTNHTAATIAGDLILQTRNGAGSSWSEAFTITSSSRLGFGTTAPGARFDCRGAAGVPVAIFNENAADSDFRVEGQTEPNLLFIDASTDRVGVGTATPGSRFSVVDAHSGAANKTSSLLTVNTSGTSGTSTQYIAGLGVAMNAGYTGGGFSQALWFDNAIASTNATYDTDGTYGYRIAGNRGVGGYARAVTTGHNVGGLFLAGGGNVNYGVWASSTIAKASATNVGTASFARNTGGSSYQVGGLFALVDASSAPTIGTSAALIADNVATTSPIILGRDNSTTVFSVLDGSGVNSFGSTEVVLNDGAANIDFRVGGATRANLLLVDAGLDRVGINRAAGTHGATLDIDNLAVAESIFIARDNGTAVFTIADGGAVTSTSTSFTIGGAGTMTWPSANASGVLTNDGSGGLSWAAAGGGTHRQEAVTTENITGTDTALSDTLNFTPTAAASVMLFLNGVFQVQGAGNDYSISGSTITWLASTGTAVDMTTSDVLIAVYVS